MTFTLLLGVVMLMTLASGKVAGQTIHLVATPVDLSLDTVAPGTRNVVIAQMTINDTTKTTVKIGSIELSLVPQIPLAYFPLNNIRIEFDGVQTGTTISSYDTAFQSKYFGQYWGPYFDTITITPGIHSLKFYADIPEYNFTSTSQIVGSLTDLEDWNLFRGMTYSPVIKSGYKKSNWTGIKNLNVTNILTKSAKFHFNWDTTYIPEGLVMELDTTPFMNSDGHPMFTIFSRNLNQYPVHTLSYGENSFIVQYSDKFTSFINKNLYWRIFTADGMYSTTSSTELFNTRTNEVRLLSSKVGTNYATFEFYFAGGLTSLTEKPILRFISSDYSVTTTDTINSSSIFFDSLGCKIIFQIKKHLEPSSNYTAYVTGVFGNYIISNDAPWDIGTMFRTSQCAYANFKLGSEVKRRDTVIYCTLPIVYPNWIQHSNIFLSTKVETSNKNIYSSFSVLLEKENNIGSFIYDTLFIPLNCNDTSGEIKVSIEMISPCGQIDRTEFLLSKHSTSGINELNNQIISVYPNPFTDKINIESEIGSSFVFININGQVVSEGLLKDPHTELSIDVPPGIYVLQIANGEKITHQKIVRE